MPNPYKGKNRYRTFLKAARIISGKISRLDGVIGVLGTGSIGRKFGDQFSDFDMTVYASDDSVKQLRKLISIGWIEYKGMEYDIPVLSYDKAMRAGVPSKFWSQVQRWHHQNSQILYDTNRRIEKLLKATLIFPERERRKLMTEYHRKIHELLVFFPEMWTERGKLYNIIDSLTQAVYYIVLWIYAKNSQFEPFMRKWLFYHLEMKAVPEHKYLNALTSVYTSHIKTKAEAMKVKDNLLDICAKIGLKWEVYSYAEALERATRNWAKASEETKRLLSW
jgi:predicted nucleotidyltransferase